MANFYYKKDKHSSDKLDQVSQQLRFSDGNLSKKDDSDSDGDNKDTSNASYWNFVR